MTKTINIQSICFDKNIWTKKLTKKWLSKNKYKSIISFEETRSEFIYVLDFPDYDNYYSFQTINGISFKFGIN